MLRAVTECQPRRTEGKRHLLAAMALLLAFLAIVILPRSVLADKGDLAQIKEAIERSELHWIAEEYGRAFPLGLLPKSELVQVDPTLPRIAEMAGLPPAIDWRDNGGNFVSPAKDQQNCASCWAFATVAALEARYCIAANTPGHFLDLSEQTLVSCVSSHYGCNGGDPLAAALFLRNQGVPPESCFPYMAFKENCAKACGSWQERAFKIASYAYVEPTAGALKTALLQGPLQVAMNVYSDFYYYRSGVYEYAWGANMGGHAVLAVGYVDTPGQYGGGYFVVKNSWGPWWGEDGFFKIGYSQISNQVAFGRLAYAYTVATPMPDAYELDDTVTEAKAIALGERQIRSLLPAGDQDWVRFALASPATIIAETSGPSGGDTTIWLYRADSLTDAIAQDEDSGDGQYSKMIAALDAGIYYLKIAERRFEAVLPIYDLNVKVIDWVDLPPTLWVKNFGSAAGGWSTQDKTPRFLADVDGDGKADIVGFGDDGVYVSLSTGTSFASPMRWIASYGASVGRWTSQDKYPRCLADINGDSKADIVGFGNTGVYVSLSTGTSFGSPKRWIASYGYSTGGWTSQDKCPRFAADVNGDGRADIVGFASNGVYVALSSGSSFATPKLWIASFGVSVGGWLSQNKHPRLVADVTGDRRADVIGFGNAGVYVAPSTGTSFAAPKLWLKDFGFSAGGWSSQDLYPRLVTDFDRDGKADIVGFKDVGVYVALSSGSNFGAPVLRKAFFGTLGGWTSYNRYPRAVADLDGDRKTDLVGFRDVGVLASLVP